MRKRPAYKGFTLIEVLLALAVASLILIAATSLLVTLSRAWAERPAAREAFDAHVNGVARFLTTTLSKAVPTPLLPNEPAIRLDRPIGLDEIDAPLISFSLKDAPPVLYWPREATAGVTCFLSFDEEEGLSILWFSSLQEMEPDAGGKLALKDEDQLFKTLLSPLVSQVSYCYYGEEDDPPEAEKEWREEDELEENLAADKYRMPTFLKLFFQNDDAERIITIPIEKPSPNGIRAEAN
ncbi:MAG: hypothetical protein CMI31_03220 [Opitutae bacterium]|nr:hypothetical protein [Opitutae bacterium]|tara:strand:+ start:559 stop:1272 length:714 start_codon:yes stop_codon:yes gene_type:complete